MTRRPPIQIARAARAPVVALALVAAASVALGASAPAVAAAQDAVEPGAAPTPPPAASQPVPPPPSAGAAGGPDRVAVGRLFAIIKSEPDIREVQRAALGHYNLEPERINDMVKKARLKGLLPEVEGGYEAVQGEHFTNTRDGLYPILPSPPGGTANPENFKERVRGEQATNSYRVRMVFNLDRLVFNAEALDAKSLNSLGENLVREVTTLYFSRRRLLAGVILSPPESDIELFYELMRLDELTATIDALTGGKFADRAWQWNEDEQADQPARRRGGR